jgi:energy-coupling factor transporter ATP-binding protein EcfA2
MIENLHIYSFRGIPSDLELSFSGDKGSVVSILLLGDNGSGKSSLADALEFCLRGKTSRRGNAGAKIRYESQNLLTGGNPGVRVTFEDNREFARGAVPRSFSGTRLKNTEFAPGFSLSPVVVSRADIDVFWQVGSADRMRFFFDYLRDSVQHPGYAALEMERAQSSLDSARVHVLEAQIALATVTGEPVGEIPVDDRASFYKWRSKAYPEYGSGPAHPFGVPDPPRMRSIQNVPAPIRSALSSLAHELETVHKLRKTIRGAQKRVGVTGQVPRVIAENLPEILSEISEQVSLDFSAIANIPHVQAVRLQPSGNGYELDVTCLLSSGREVQPTQILSEGSLDLLALLILLGVTRACAALGQTRFLVLDDVWQSVDVIHRESILQYVFSERFRDWQLVISVHDRLWARLIEDKARKHNFALKALELIDWTPEQGPRLRLGSFDTGAQLSKLIDSEAPPEALAAYTGRALEELSDRLSVSMGTAVTRKSGDRYTLEDMWSGVYSKLSKANWNPQLKEAANEVNSRYALRNIYGAHYSTWAQSLSETEVRDFARWVVALWKAASCGTCGVPLGRHLGEKEIRWLCGHTSES